MKKLIVLAVVSLVVVHSAMCIGHGLVSIVLGSLGLLGLLGCLICLYLSRPRRSHK